MGICGGIPLGKELRVDGFESFLINQTTWALVFEAPVKGLQLLLGEFGLSLQLLQTLGLMSHRGQLKVTVTAVYGRESAKKKRERKRGKAERKGGEKGVGLWDAGQDGVKEHFKEGDSGSEEKKRGRKRGVKAKELA